MKERIPVSQRGMRKGALPVAYDGFNPSESDTEFVSVMDEARRLGDYIVEHYGGRIDVLYTLSYGCRVLLEVLADKRLIITTAIADGMSTDKYPNIKSDVERKLAGDIRKWQDAGYAFTYKVFTNVGHGGLITEHTEQFIEEVKAAHADSLAK